MLVSNEGIIIVADEDIIEPAPDAGTTVVPGGVVGLVPTAATSSAATVNGAIVSILNSVGETVNPLGSSINSSLFVGTSSASGLALGISSAGTGVVVAGIATPAGGVVEDVTLMLVDVDEEIVARDIDESDGAAVAVVMLASCVVTGSTVVTGAIDTDGSVATLTATSSEDDATDGRFFVNSSPLASAVSPMH